MASRGQIMPLNSMRGKQEPIDIFIASMEVLQITDKNNPKLIPAKPVKGLIIIERIGPFTLEQCDKDEPSNRSTTRELEDKEHSDEGDGSLIEKNNIKS